MLTILITGGSGLLGRRLSQDLLTRGHQVRWLSRTEDLSAHIPRYKWDIQHHYVNPEAFVGVDVIIHLAGAGVFDAKWTAAYKQEMYDSRVKSTLLLYDFLEKKPNQVKHFMAASAIGYYGNSEEKLFTESDPAGHGFLARLTADWEEATLKMATIGIATTTLRVGIVLDKDGGALYKLAQPIRYGLGAALGIGTQIMSWIHIEDLSRMFIWCMDGHRQGIYNAVAPVPVTNAYITKAIARICRRPLFMPNVPGFILQIILGKGKAEILLGSQRVSGQKVLQEGFEFKYSTLEHALANIYSS